MCVLVSAKTQSGKEAAGEEEHGSHPSSAGHRAAIHRRSSKGCATGRTGGAAAAAADVADGVVRVPVLTPLHCDVLHSLCLGIT